MGFGLQEVLDDFASGLEMADSRGPRYRHYQPGIGTFPEKMVVEKVLREMQSASPEKYRKSQVEFPYPPPARGLCDLVVGASDAWEWALEVKAMRIHDNGRYDHVYSGAILSPYSNPDGSNRSAITDCDKLLAASPAARSAVMIIGYDYESFPILAMVDAFETLAEKRLALGPRHTSPFRGLMHPHHKEGLVLAWEVPSA